LSPIKWSTALTFVPADVPSELVDQLVGSGFISGDADFFPMHGGRSNLVWRIPGEPECVLKLYGKKNKNPLFANDAQLEQLAMRVLAPADLSPRLITSGQFGQRAWILYRHISGSCWSGSVGDVARLLGRLHAQALIPGMPKGRNGSEELAAQTRHILSLLDSPRVSELLDMQPVGRVGQTLDIAVVHRDPVPGNLVGQGSLLTLIDWQCPALGDPAEDLAVFLSPAMQVLYNGSVLGPEKTAQFLAAYPDSKVASRYRHLSPWYHWRMAAYCLWKTHKGNHDYLQGMQLELSALKEVTA
jgi:thiamine kinase-like enzyme